MFIKERACFCLLVTSPVPLFEIQVNEATGTVCADTGASQSVGGELMFKFLKNRGQKFTELYLSMCLADDQQSTPLVQKAYHMQRGTGHY
ncbi:transposon Tf2-6 polyprotein [Nephila pilipes]|uniref:Transposon Tf2-6 polyprotein n=1 Tax=Nephila pilipes TaxID=299642 RepID=A0A8X6NXN1_NEPPI|nr:transposon Tf2-6 polyprotein [Nephila pilipes]